MNNNNNIVLLVQVVACAYITIVATLALLLLIQDVEEATPRAERVRITSQKLQVLRSVKRRLDRFDDDDESPNKKQKKNFDCERARLAIQQDYLGPERQFDDRQFSRIFRLTRGIVEKIIQVAGNYSPFFTQRHLLTGEPGICPEAKVLMAIKQLAFGVSGSAFLDYFQMGLTTATDCVKHLAKAIATSEELRGKCLRQMTASDARKVSAPHEERFGIPGCIGCLDCMHVHWRTCPYAWQGQYQGKEGKASIALEGVTDYGCWFWHHAFGPPGSLNDINIFDRSTLLKSMLDGTFTDELDFEFIINSKTFSQLWLFVDGIYPEISRFVKTISIPLGGAQSKYALWQESARKSVERAFGILQRKFQILAKPIELWYSEDITHVVETCIILHNMMVEVRIDQDVDEQDGFYDLVPPPSTVNSNSTEETNSDEATTNNEGEEEPTGEGTSGDVAEDDGSDTSDDEFVITTTERRSQRRRSVSSQWPCPANELRVKAIKTYLQKSFDERQSRWDELYNEEAHFMLRDSIIDDTRKKRTCSNK